MRKLFTWTINADLVSLNSSLERPGKWTRTYRDLVEELIFPAETNSTTASATSACSLVIFRHGFGPKTCTIVFVRRHFGRQR